MKVLVCARGYNSFGENKLGSFELDQAKALKAAGCDVRLAALDLRSARRLRPFGAKLHKVQGMHCVSVNAFSSMFSGELSDKLSSRAAQKALHWICNDGWQPDIIHAHFTEIASAFAQQAKGSGAKFVVTEHSSLMNTAEPDAVNLRLAKNAYLKADKVIAVSKALAENIDLSVGVTPEVIGNVVDANVFEHTSKGSGEDSFKFVSCGNLVEVKCFDVLLEAFSRISDKTAQLTIFGDGVKKAELVSLCEKLGISGRVHFMGHCQREDIAREYEKSDAFVLASRSETFGVSFVEAMCAGLPVIATCCGGPQDFVNDQNGLLVPVEDADALAQAMNELQQNRNSYDSQSIRTSALEKYSPQGVAQQLIRLYETLLNS